MGYLHIENLYRAQTILLFKRCYALEKTHGTSAHLSFKNNQLHYFAGGESHQNFLKLFDEPALLANFAEIGHPEVVVFGEAYGGKQQGMSGTYGKELRFIAFDVKVGDHWLNVPNAEKVATKLGLEFVPWREVDTDIETLNFERDRPSEIAERRGCGTDKTREGVVLRPLMEFRMPNGDRVICKHKGEKFQERSTPQTVGDPAKLIVLQEAEEIANEWATPHRLEHVLQKLPECKGMESTRAVIAAMVEDIYREAAGEIVESKEATGAIGRKTAVLFKAWLKRQAGVE